MIPQQNNQPDRPVRLQKYLADCGVDSRRHCEEYIAAGRVKVNGIVTTVLGTKIVSGRDAVTFDGKPVRPSVNDKPLYIMLHKPRGYIVTARDTHGRKTVFDLLRDIPIRIFPVGRLDMDSEGLLLLTNDGEWANRISHPSHEVEKEYLVTVNGIVTDDVIDRLRRGIKIEDGFMTAPAQIKRVRQKSSETTTLSVTIHEGHKRQVRLMMRAVGVEVCRLKRIREGRLLLNELPLGAWRRLTSTELELL